MSDFLFGDKRPVILTVDDDEMNLLLMKRIFAKDADIFCLNSGSKALEWLAEHDPDIVLLDYRMPAPNGFDILKNMKEDKRLANIPVIIVTGDIEADLECEGFMLGATDFIRKPFMPAVVRERVRRVLQYEYLQDNLENEVKRQTNLANQRLESIVRLYNETAFALAKAVDAKDAYTSGHSSRVAKYSRMIAERSGAGREEQDEIYTIALLHDIGKIGIPIAIINKPARLTDQEYEIMKTHTTKGFSILEIIEEMPKLATGARSHHERYDGRGYPDHIAGDKIPKYARIISVADAYDAMTSRRSYREAMSQELVRREIEQGIGTQFDPMYAKIMLQLIDEDKDYTMREVQ